MEPRGEKQVLEFLLAAGLEPAVSRFVRGTETAEATARELGVPVCRIVKSLVFDADGAPLVALLPGDRRAHTASIRRLTGAGKIRFADPEKVLEWTGYEVGAVPPVAHRRPTLVLVDDAIPSEGDIFPAAGEKNNAFRTSFEELVRLTGGRVCAISIEQR